MQPLHLYQQFRPQRHLLGPLGDESNWKVRLSNRIVLNLVGFGANMVRLGSKWNGLVL